MEHSFLVDYLIATSNSIHNSVGLVLFLSFIWIMVVFMFNNCLSNNKRKSYKTPLIIAIISAILLVVVPTTETFEQGLSQNFRLRLNVE